MLDWGSYSIEKGYLQGNNNENFPHPFWLATKVGIFEHAADQQSHWLAAEIGIF